SQTCFQTHPDRKCAAIKAHALTLLLPAFCHALPVVSVSCVKLPRHVQTITETASATTQREPNATPRLDINTATSAELEPLPVICPGFATRIIAHRQRYGPFRRV